MKTTILGFACLCLCGAMLQAQNLIPIPDTLSGNDIQLSLADSSKEFFPGFQTATFGYNGAYLGPTLMLNQGQSLSLHVTNLLQDTTTTHWHGLHVAPMNDGGPHSPILPGDTWNPAFTVMDHAATYFYHPHMHGNTMPQVLMGAAGMIIVRDPNESALVLPRSYGVDDFPLVCQFQTFNASTKQIVLNDEFDNTTLVNGTVNPMLNVPAQVVRLRLVNASSHRVLQFGFNDGRTFHQITSDGGLLDAPVPLTRLRLGTGERAELLVDFAGQAGNTYYIQQFGNELPAGYPGGPAMMGNPIGPLDNITFNFLEIQVVPSTPSPVTTIPATLASNSPWSSSGASAMNFLFQGSPMMSMTNFTINGLQFDPAVVNFSKQLDDIMVWNITNQSMMAHPFHIHGNHFFIQSINGATPALNLRGRKDVVLIGPQGGTASLIMKFEDFSDPMMPYMYHCHILSHEDKGMMGQFTVLDPAASAENGEGIRVNVYPNPATEFVEIAAEGGAGKIEQVQMLDLMGRRVAEMGQLHDANVQLPTAEYAKGVYLLVVRIDGRIHTKRLELR